MKWTQKNIPNLKGKTIIVTGASSGMGLEITKALTQKGAEVIMAIRNVEKAEIIIESILSDYPTVKLKAMELELSKMSSVKTFSENFKKAYGKLDVLINNAGVGGPVDVLTEDGFGYIMGVNYFAHFALTGYLLDVLLQTSQSRVISISSSAHKNVSINLDTFDKETANTYSESKLANLMFAIELQRRFELNDVKVKSIAAHPGASKTEGMTALINSNKYAIVRNFLDKLTDVIMQNPAMGALSALRAATDEKAKGGEYYGPDGFMGIRGYPKQVKPFNSALNIKLGFKLWEKSLELTKAEYNFINKS